MTLNRRPFVFVLAILVAGCAHEQILDRSSPGPPAWQLTPPRPSGERVSFVGRSLAVNVLDERHGVNEAIDDAAYQIARSIASDVGGTVSIIDSRKGEQIRGRETTDQSSHSQVVIDVKNIVSGLTHENTYWEKWSVRESSMGSKVRRYKYWVLVSFPKAELDRMREEVKKKLKTR